MRKLYRTDRFGFAVLPRRSRWWLGGMLLGAMILNGGASGAATLGEQAVEAAPSSPAASLAKPESGVSSSDQAESPKGESRRAKARKARKAREEKARQAKLREEKAQAEKRAKEEKAKEEKARADQTALATQPAPRPTSPTSVVAAPPPPALKPAVAAKPAPDKLGPDRPVSDNGPVFPGASGFGLAMGLGALWLILRWRSRWAKRAGEVAKPVATKAAPPIKPKPQPAPRQSPPPAPPKASAPAAPAPAPVFQSPAPPPEENPAIALVVKEAEAFAGIPWTRDMQPEPLPPIRPADEQPRKHEPEPPLTQVVSIFTPEPESVPEPETGPAEARPVFKPSALFAQIEPPEPVPFAPPEPEVQGVEFASIRLEVQRLAFSAASAELRFAIILRNETLDLVDPFRLDACMGTPEGDLPETAQSHAIARMLPGQTITIAGEWRVPVATLPCLRIGAVRLFVGAARIVATVEDAPGRPKREVAFLIGLPEEDGRLAPIPLDGAARIYDNLAVQTIAPDQS